MQESLTLYNLTNEQLALYLATINKSFNPELHLQIADKYLKWLNENKNK
jgi:hypothetical protein